MNADTAEVRALRQQVRDWREGRAEKSLYEVLSDAYIALFATVMLGAMGFNVIRQVRVAATAACTTGVCEEARNALPWTIALATVGLTLIVARLFGPLLISPAEGAWLFAAPVDRRSLLRPRLVLAAIFSLLTGMVLGAVDSTIGGFGAAPAAAFVAILAVACLAMAMLAAVDQPLGGRFGRGLTWTLAAVLWIGLLLVAMGEVPRRIAPPQRVGPISIGVLLALIGLAAALLVRAHAGLIRMQRDRLSAGGSLLSNLSGAFASLDPTLAYDLLMTRRWRSKATVRPVRGGPAGTMTLVWRDVIRLRRSPQTVLILAAALVVPYVASTVGLGKAVTLVAALTGFLAGLGLCTGLRVLTRTPGLIRCLPMSAAAVRTAGLAVPAAVLIAWGVATTPAIHHAMAPLPWAGSANVGFTIGLAALTAVTRWITAKPPDYSAPLVTSPAGAIPPSMFGTVLRGLDVLLLLTAPLLLLPPASGSFVSNLLAFIVLAVLLNRKTT